MVVEETARTHATTRSELCFWQGFKLPADKMHVLSHPLYQRGRSVECIFTASTNMNKISMARLKTPRLRAHWHVIQTI